MLGKRYDGQDCTLARALEVLGERWTFLVVRDAFFGVRRFDDFAAHLGIPRAVLSDRLRGLVGNGVLARLPDDERASRYIYVLTEAGRELWPAIHALISWGARHRPPSTRRYSHVSCGTELDVRAACPSCATVPDPEDVLMTHLPEDACTRTDPVTVALREPHRMLRPLETRRNTRVTLRTRHRR